MEIQPNWLRVQKYLTREFKSSGWDLDSIEDPRKNRGQRWELFPLLSALVAGMSAGCRSLREVEDLTEASSQWGKRFFPRRVPDTTMWDVIVKLDPEELRAKLTQQIKCRWRAKMLKPVGLPCGVISIDGKGLGALEHDAKGTAQENHREDGSAYYLSRMLRAVLISAEARPCVDQLAIRAKTNEMGDFGRFWDRLIETYGKNNDLFEIVSVDAGMVSKANADRIHSDDKAYVMALKGCQPELLTEAERLLSSRRKPDAETPWERAKGKRVCRRIYRTTEMVGFHGWDHLRQVWRVEQLAESKDGRVEKLERYFATSAPLGRLTPEQCLLVVRAHWRIENDCFWSLDTQWEEDMVPWCSRGRAVEVLSWIRLMTYNILQALRRKHLRLKKTDGTTEPPHPWHRTMQWVKLAWIRWELLPVTR